VSAFLSYLSKKKIASFTHRITLSSVACLVLVCSNKSSHKQHGFGKKKNRLIWKARCDCLLNFCLKEFSS
jgi:hypothetical protein